MAAPLLDADPWDEPLTEEDEMDERTEGALARRAIAEMLLRTAQEDERSAASYLDAERARAEITTARARLAEAQADLEELEGGTR